MNSCFALLGLGFELIQSSKVKFHDNIKHIQVFSGCYRANCTTLFPLYDSGNKKNQEFSENFNIDLIFFSWIKHNIKIFITKAWVVTVKLTMKQKVWYCVKFSLIHQTVLWLSKLSQTFRGCNSDGNSNPVS